MLSHAMLYRAYRWIGCLHRWCRRVRPVPTRSRANDFVGEWRGAEVSIDAPDEVPKLAPSDLDMTITEANGGFQIRALALRREPDGTLAARQLEAAFAPTEVPGVFAFDPGSGSLLSSLFADPAVGNPLKRDTFFGPGCRTTPCTCAAWRSTRPAGLRSSTLQVD
jgi:hypothetical protein